MSTPVQINITESAAPKNAATVDQGLLVGNSYTKQQVLTAINDKIGNVVSGFKEGINPTTPIPTGGWERGIYIAEVSGTYTNAGGIVVDLTYGMTFLVYDTNWSKVVVPTLTAEKEFNATDDIKPSTMKAAYDASPIFIEKAFEGTEFIYSTLGKDLNYTMTAPNYAPSFFQWNTSYLSKAAVMTKLKIWSGSNATLKYYHISSNGVVKGSFTTPVVIGINEIDLNINGAVGDTIGIQPVNMTIGHTAGTPDMQYSNGAGGFNNGYLAYTVDVKEDGPDGYSLEEIKSLLSKVRDNTLAKTSIEVSRITIEGQSNALGVGFRSGLLVPPFSNKDLDWTKEFSRVFIWNPKTTAYENIKIGVNNMASWDADYTGGPPTPEATFGCEIGVALLWLQTNKQGYLFIDKNVGDGKPISYFQKGTGYYTEKKIRRDGANAWLSARGFNPIEIGFIWVQGEGDMAQTKEYYKTQLTTLVNDRKTDEFISSFTSIIITQVPAGTGNYGAGVANAKVEYVNENEKARLINYTNNFNSDNVHLNTAGQINLGLDSAKEVFLTEKYSIADIDGKSNWTI